MQVGGCLDSMNWISLADYSAKYKVSISTLRRRIKNEQIEYAFDNGKYFLPDLGLKSISKAKKSFSQVAPPNVNPSNNGLQLGQHFFGKDFLESLDDEGEELSLENREDVFGASYSFSATVPQPENFERVEPIREPQKLKPESKSMKEALEHMTQELKKAYSAILQEKEEQLFILKEQVVDLKTLVNILESENQRLSERPETRLTPHVIREKSQF